MKAVAVLTFFIILNGCASMNLSESGKHAKIVEPELIKADKCTKGETFLQITPTKVNGQSPSMVISDLRNKIAEMKSNVGVTRFNLHGEWSAQNGYTIPMGTRIPVETYTCTDEFWASLPGME